MSISSSAVPPVTFHPDFLAAEESRTWFEQSRAEVAP